MAFVTIRIKGSEGYTRVALGKERMVLGRASEADVPIKHTSISREHCAFVREGDGWAVEDLGSSNGTWVNKDKVAGRKALAEKDIVKAGKARLTFHLGDMDAPEAVIDLSSHDDEDEDGEGENDAEAPVRALAPDEPHDAMRCGGCTAWLSVAHRRTGDKLACPRCSHANTVRRA